MSHTTRPSLRFTVAVIVSLAALPVPTTASAQEAYVPERPVPGPLVAPPVHRAAVARGTRTADGRPGPAYWQPYTRYDIDARLDPETGEVMGRARITYENRSPSPLDVIVINLYQNLHAPGAMRNESQEVTGGVTLQRVAADGTELQQGPLSAGPAFVVDGTLMGIRPPESVPAGGTVELEVDWQFVVPQNGAGRMGHSNREMYFLAYWFPRPVVYDDLRGWDAEPYLASAEFYDGYGDYEVRLNVPVGWTVMATGELQNDEEVYTPAVRERLDRAAISDEVVRIVSPDELEAGTVTATPGSGRLTYLFHATNVRDFTWTASNVQSWDATSAVVAAHLQDKGADQAHAAPARRRAF